MTTGSGDTIHRTSRQTCILICTEVRRENESFEDGGRTAGAWKASTAATTARTATAHFIIDERALRGAEKMQQAIRSAETAKSWRRRRLTNIVRLVTTERVCPGPPG